jgi:membrane-associated phospholipid phosphatase
MRPAPALAALAAAGALLAAPAASAQMGDGGRPIAASLTVDGAVIAGALALTALASLVPVDTSARWPRELLPIDEPVKRNFSAAAARTSDVLVALVAVTPLALQLGRGWDADTGRRSLVYGETIALSLALNAATKYLVARPRPYVYNRDPQVAAYARGQRKDSHLSFYSGHAATAFAAAAGGAYLYSQSTGDTRARTAVWAGTLALAGATANLRVRGGKHFYSDVAVGAVAGTGLGLAVPLLHQRGQARNRLTTPEWVAIAAAPLAGAALSQLLPMAADITTPLAGRGRPGAITTTAVLLPWICPPSSGGGGGGGGGLTLLGRL